MTGIVTNLPTISELKRVEREAMAAYVEACHDQSRQHELLRLADAWRTANEASERAERDCHEGAA